VVGGQEDGGRAAAAARGVLEELSRELKVEAHRLAAWREDFLEGGKDALKGQRLDRSSDDRALRQAERKVGQLTMENEILYDAVIDRWGQLGPDIARGLRLRHDWGPQYRSGHFRGSIAWLGIADNASFLGEPETNGCAERWIRTLKEQCLWAELHDTIDQLRQAVSCLSTATTTRG
jgi:transposase InsO family protein